MKSMKMNTNFWKLCRKASLTAVSALLVGMMVVSLLVNSGIAQLIAEQSDAVYITNAIWFAVIAFISCKRLRDNTKETTAKATGKYAKKEKVD